MSIVWAFLKSHWTLGLLPPAFAAGWLLHKRPPPPLIDLHSESGYVGAETETVHVVATQGPVRIVTRTVTTPAPGCVGPTTDQTVTEERAPVVTETDHLDETRVAGGTRTDLRVVPSQQQPRYALGAGLEDPLGTKRLRVEGGLRILGPIWLRATLTPAQGLSGTSIGGEVEW